MKKMSIKSKRKLISVGLIVICLVLIGSIYLVLNKDKDDFTADTVEGAMNSPQVEEFGTNLEQKELMTDESVVVDTVNNSVEDANKPIDSIITETVDENEEGIISELTIDVPMPDAPENPTNIPPETKPETKDDLTNPDQKPEYDEEDTTYIPEVESIGKPSEVTSEPSTLVPPAENPFANPSNAANPTEMDSSDYSDYVPGTGDKF